MTYRLSDSQAWIDSSTSSSMAETSFQFRENVWRLPASASEYFSTGQRDGRSSVASLSDTSELHELFTRANGNGESVAVMSASQTFAIRLVATILAGFSLVFSVVAFFWFAKMRKAFRHRLIMMLISADVVRSLWLFIFPVVAMAKNSQIPTSSALCQIAGFFTQAGNEGVDCAILAIAIHTTLQVFRPDWDWLGPFGLYHRRRYVYAFVVLFPLVDCALAFTNKDLNYLGYTSQGPICTLPLTPIWYRLGLSWIPRYLIMIGVPIMYLTVYIYISRQLKKVEKLRGSNNLSESLSFVSAPDNGGSAAGPESPAGKFERNNTINTLDSTQARIPQLYYPVPSLAGSLHKSDRNHSNGTTLVGDSRTGSILKSHEQPTSKPNNVPSIDEIMTEHELPTAFTSPTATASTPTSPHTPIFRHVDFQQQKSPSKAARPKNVTIAPEDDCETSIAKQERAKYLFIRRQVSLLFIYPTAYFIIWVIPLVNQALRFNTSLMIHPNFPLYLLTFACISIMGAVDCVVFAWRERPWRHIPGSDKTFLGSFLVWKHSAISQETAEARRRRSVVAVRRAHALGMPMEVGSVNSSTMVELELDPVSVSAASEEHESLEDPV